MLRYTWFVFAVSLSLPFGSGGPDSFIFPFPIVTSSSSVRGTRAVTRLEAVTGLGACFMGEGMSLVARD